MTAAKSPNPYRDPKPWQRVIMGGRRIKAILREYNGVKVTDEWKVDKSKSQSGGSAKFAGTKLVDDIVLTLEAPDEATFDDLGDIWNLLAPVPGQGSAATPPASAGSTFAIGSPAAKPGTDGGSGSTSAPAGGTSTPFGVADPTAAKDKKDSKSKDPDPGPRPPTIPIELAALKFIGVVAVARKSWEGPYPSEGNSWQVKIGLIESKPPTPAGAGTMGPVKPGSQYAIGNGAGPGTPQDNADKAKKDAAAEAGGV